MLRASFSDASSIDLHRYLSLGQVSGFEDDNHVPQPPPVPSSLSTRAQLNLRPADVPISHGNTSKAMLRAHAADARYWRPQTTGNTRRANSRPADDIRRKAAPAPGVDKAVVHERPHSATVVSYMDDAAILEAMKQDKALWARVHSPSPAVIPGEKTKKSALNPANRRPPVHLPARSIEHQVPSVPPPFSSEVDVSVASSPPPLPPRDDPQFCAQLLSPSPTATQQLQSPSSSGQAARVSTTPSATKAHLPSHGGLMPFLALERKWPQHQQHNEQEQPFVQHQAKKPRSPLKSTVAPDVHSPLRPAFAVSAFNMKSPQSVQSLPKSAPETHGASSTSSPGTVTTGLRRLMLEYAQTLSFRFCRNDSSMYDLCKQMDAVAISTDDACVAHVRQSLQYFLVSIVAATN